MLDSNVTLNELRSVVARKLLAMKEGQREELEELCKEESQLLCTLASELHDEAADSVGVKLAKAEVLANTHRLGFAYVQLDDDGNATAVREHMHKPPLVKAVRSDGYAPVGDGEAMWVKVV